MTALDSRWRTIDSWWDSYVREQEADLVELQEVLDALDEKWSRSDCRFDRDPLGTDWTETNPQAGPLRTNQEENWSQWLAHLIRSSSGDFVRELFGESFDATPDRVRRERAIHDDELHDRRVDIVVEFADRGLSIEVKIGDEHYGKTPQTAYLTENDHPRTLDWTHLLLLPASKQPALAETFGSRLAAPDSERSTITPAGSREREITVMNWQDMSQGLRRTLSAGGESESHWEASAYLFTTLIEQQLLRFHTAPSLDHLREKSLGILDVERIQSIDPAVQLEYLTTALEEHNG